MLIIELIDNSHCINLLRFVSLSYMTMVLFLLVVLLLMLVFFLFTPIVLKVDTSKKEYYVQIKGIIMCSIVWQDELVMKVRIPFYNFDVKPLKKTKKKKAVKKKSKNTLSTRRVKSVLKVLKSFKVKQFSLNIDTSNVVSNGYLYPLFFFLNKKNRRMTINYEGRVELLVHLENRLINMIWAYLK